MRSCSVASVVLMLVLFGYCAPEKSKLEGAWELVSAKYTLPDTTIEITQNEWESFKILSRSHFVWVGQEPKRSKPGERKAHSEVLGVLKSLSEGGGEYTLGGDKYVERVKYSLLPNFGQFPIYYEYRLEGDEWTVSGTLPTKSLGLKDCDVGLLQVWKKVE